MRSLALGRPWTRPAALVAAAGLAAVGTWAVTARSGETAGDGSGSAAAATTTATVTRRDLVARDSFSGSLGFDDERAVASGLTGTMTGIRSSGDVVRPGGVLYRVDGKPVVLLDGWYPLWRSLSSGDEGLDVRQLEANLVALGYDPDGDIEVDGEFDWATRAAVLRWQDDLGVTEDGVVDPSDAVFLPGKRRVGEVKAAVGSRVSEGSPILETTSTRRLVTVELDARRQTLVTKGQRVTVKLPDGRTIAGTIQSVGKVAERLAGDEDAEPTIKVKIAVAGGSRSGNLDQAPVDVGIARERKSGVLTVPVTALLALAGGGYAVEVGSGGTTRLVRVQPGLFADGLVEIQGEGIREGMKVVVPR